ncbi:beta strand repeat-containing protein [Kitasatospora sp. NPDC006697]|uniref:beta strand repeat-containing protein n=1 Tax=Kitasatospora sp. NPDC006697 TaxID=3364020 RepID=UPI0036789C3D
MRSSGLGLAVVLASVLASATLTGTQPAAAAPGTATKAAAAPPATATGLVSPQQAAAQARATGHPVPATTLTTETSQTVVNPDGTLTLTQSAVPTRMFRKGAWTDLDATLKTNPDGTLSPTTALTSVILSGGGDGPLASFHNAGQGFSLTLPVTLPHPVLSGPKAVYADVLPGVDLTVTVQAAGTVSDVFTVRTPAAARDPRLAGLLDAKTSTTPGVRIGSDAAGNLAVSDAGGQPLYTAPAPRAWDSAGTPATTGAPKSAAAADAVGAPAPPSTVDAPARGAHIAKLKAEAGPGRVSLAPPTDLLTSPDSVFPLFVDPAYTPNYGNTGYSSPGAGYPNSSYWNNSVDPDSTTTQVGNSGGSEGEAMSLFDFPIDLNTLRGANISKAYFGITETHTWAGPTAGHDQAVNLFAPSATLDSTNATWNSWAGNLGGPVGQLPSSGTPDPSGAISPFEVTTTVANDVAAGKGTQTFAMRADDGLDHYAFKEFDATTANLTVVYDLYPNAPGGLFTSPATNCSSTVLGDTSVSLYAPVSTPTNSQLTTTFKLYKTADGAKTNLLTPANQINSNTYTGASGQAAVLPVPESFFKNQSNGSATSFSWQVQASDGTLQSPVSSTCTFTWDPSRPGAPTIKPNPAPPSGTQTCADFGDTTDAVQQIGTTCSFIVTPPNGSSVSGYLFQVNQSPPVTVAATGATAISVPVQYLVNTLTVSALSAGGNPGPATPDWFDGAKMTTPAKDGDLSLDGTPDLVVPGNSAGTAFPPGLWLATGHADGTVTREATDIGTNGLGINPGTTNPGDWNGAQAVTGDFCGYGAQDVLAYFPTGSRAGGGGIACNDGSSGPLHQGSAVSLATTQAPLTIPAGTFEDSQNNKALRLAAAGNSSGNAKPGAPDLLATINNQLYLVSSAGPNNYTMTLNCRYRCVRLTAMNSPDGTQDWNNWTIATVQLSSGTAMYLWNPGTGALDLWTGLALSTNSNGSTLTGAAQQYTVATGWNTGKTLQLRAADIAGKGVPGLWATDPSTGSTTAYLPTALADNPTVNTAVTTLDTSKHAWAFQDIGSATPGTTVTSTADAVGSISLTGTSGAVWHRGDVFSPDVLLNTASDGTTRTAGTGSLDASGPAVAFSGTDDFTVSARVKPNAMDGIVLSQDGTRTSGFTLYPDSGTGFWSFCMAKSDTNGAGYDCARGGKVQLGVWTRLTASYQASTGIMTLYVNGVQTRTASHTPVTGFAGAFHIGDYLTNGVHAAYYSGQVADVHTWNQVAPPAQPQTPGARYVPVTPTRLMDTRGGTGGTGGPITSTGTAVLSVTGAAGIPTAGVTGVALSITSAGATGPGFLTAFPDGTPLPFTSNVNYPGGTVVTNGAIVPVGSNGKVDIYNYGGNATAQIIVDVTGYYTTDPAAANAGWYVPVLPSRLVDTRNGTGAAQSQLASGGTLTVGTSGALVGLIPASGVTAVALNLTAADQTGSAYLNAYPTGTSRPLTSNVSYHPGTPASAFVIAAVDGNGNFTIGNGNGGPVDVIADVVGFYTTNQSGYLNTPGQLYHPLDSTRVLDTRQTGGTLTGSVTNTYPGSVVSAVNPTLVANLTATQEAANGFLAVSPGGYQSPLGTATVNYQTGVDVADLDLIQATNNSYNVTNSWGSTQLVVDVNGYFANY